MTFTQIAAQGNRATGFVATINRSWPANIRGIDLQIDVWGAGGAADPWTGIAQPFNDPAKSASAEFTVTFADGRTQMYATTWVGHADGNFGSTKPGSTPTQPIQSIDFAPGAELPVSLQLVLRCISGPITAGLSVQLDRIVALKTVRAITIN